MGIPKPIFTLPESRQVQVMTGLSEVEAVVLTTVEIISARDVAWSKSL